jgi:cytochrome c oxidase subunit 2
MSREWPGARCAAAPVVAVIVASSLTGCGSDGNPTSLSPAAERGRDVARANGCSACHGTDGEGGVGPPFVGLYGSQVTLSDGSTVVADDAYVAEATRDPGASRVAGYAIDMPGNDLDDAQIAAVVTYIRELGVAGSQT